MSAAVISPDGVYRYRLDRELPTQLETRSRTVCFVMLNPSTADADQDDPTIRRCLGFAETWGYDKLVVVNLFGYPQRRPVRRTDRSAVAAPAAANPGQTAPTRRHHPQLCDPPTTGIRVGHDRRNM